MEITLFQTLEDRDNPDEIEKNGPFPCRNPTAWLGSGYYFWDTYVDLGHWWGKTVYGQRYIVCKATGILDSTCWDLHGNGTHRLEFEKVCEELVTRKIAKKEEILVSQVISFLQRSQKWPFQAIRALATDSISNNASNRFIVSRIKFKKNNVSFLDLRPPIQFCLLSKRALSLKDYSIIYPKEYVDYEYV